MSRTSRLQSSCPVVRSTTRIFNGCGTTWPGGFETGEGRGHERDAAVIDEEWDLGHVAPGIRPLAPASRDRKR